VDVQRAAGLKARLRDSGLRATGPRAEVLAVLEDLGGHRTAEEIYDTLAARDAGVPRPSVYNVLTMLSEAGLVLKADAGPGVVLYEAGGRRRAPASASWKRPRSSSAASARTVPRGCKFLSAAAVAVRVVHQTHSGIILILHVIDDRT
jgi:DNA-binding transcriptional ArsR family regulator